MASALPARVTAPARIPRARRRLGGVGERRERGRAQLLGGAEAQRRREVERDQLDDLVAAAGERPLDPVRDGAMHARAIAPRQALVRDLADQRVLEDQLALAAHRRRKAAEDEIAVLQAVEQLADRRRHRARRPRRPRPARTRGRRPPRSAARASRRPAAGRCARRAPRARCRAGRSGCRSHRCACARSPRGRTGCLRPARRSRRARGSPAAARSSSSCDQLGALVGIERLDREPGEAPPPAAPGRPPRRQLGPRRAEEEQRAGGVVGDVLEQLEHRRVGPVDVLDEHDGRRGRRERREERAPGEVRLGAHLLRAALRDDRRREADARGETRASSPGASAPAAASTASAASTPARRATSARVGVERMRVRLQQLGQRPVGDPVAVGEAAAAHRGVGAAASSPASSSPTRRLLPTPASP